MGGGVLGFEIPWRSATFCPSPNSTEGSSLWLRQEGKGLASPEIASRLRESPLLGVDRDGHPAARKDPKSQLSCLFMRISRRLSLKLIALPSSYCGPRLLEHELMRTREVKNDF